MTALTLELASSFAFGPFLLLPERHLLLENGEPVRIGRRSFDLLTALVRCCGQVVTKRELLSLAWPGLVVEECNLKVNIAAIRRRLGEGSGPPHYIATVFGRGYRFVATVRCLVHRDQALDPTPSGRAGNLPPCTKTIYGREDAINSIVKDLQNVRLVSIVGPGGVGKTTVGLAVADKAADAFKGGAWLVDLSMLTEPSQVPEAIANAIRSSAGTGDEGIRIDDQLRDHEMLLLLDNCEHVIGAVATCADQLLMSTRKLKLIATSREPMCIRGERVRRLRGLGLPPVLENISARDALAFPAVQLFADRAATKSTSFRLDDAMAPIVIAICRRLDGHALAIERVAQRIGALGLAGMLDHLNRRFQMLDGYHEGPERHRTLTATADASFTLLSPSEQAVMRRLSTFDGAFSLESACVIGGAQDIDRDTAVEAIGRLVAKSLLSADSRNDEMQYRQDHVTRAFALEKLIEHGELVQTQRQLAEHLTELLGHESSQDE